MARIKSQTEPKVKAERQFQISGGYPSDIYFGLRGVCDFGEKFSQTAAGGPANFGKMTWGRFGKWPKRRRR
jgi:hypothetical protein